MKVFRILRSQLVIFANVYSLLSLFFFCLVWFELQSICVGIVRIKNLATGRYLAMDKHGRLRGRVSILVFL